MAGTSPKTLNGVKAAWILAITMSGLMLLFIFARWTRFLLQKSPMPLVRITRHCRKFLLQRVSGFTSAGHAFLVLVYVAANVVLSFTNVDMSDMEHVGARFGWMCLANFAFVVFLALKNTPLAILTDYSYERLNQLHQVAGYTTVVHMLIHMITFCAAWSDQDELEKLLLVKNVMGIVAGVAMFVMFLSALFVMRSRYEIFYALHIIMFLLAVITTGMHRPKWRNEVPKVACVIAALWVLDRIIRSARMLYNMVNNSATVEALPNDVTRIVLKKSLPWAVAGRHCFLWMPKVRLLETHPFTIVSNTSNGLELMAKSHDGFTKSLREFASSAAPRTSTLASVDGPYGTVPDLAEFDRVFLFAGGSGGTFVFGLVNDLVQRQFPKSQTSIEIVWATKKYENISWFANHINALAQNGLMITVTVYLTDEKQGSGESSDSETTPAMSQVQVGHHGQDLSINEKFATRNLAQESDASSPEAAADGTVSPAFGWSPRLHYGKLHLEGAISGRLGSTSARERVLFAVCGPVGMGNETREIVNRLMPVEGPSVTLHVESFGW